MLTSRVAPPNRDGAPDGEGGSGRLYTGCAGSIIALFKPQFEANKDEVPRRGVIRDPLLHATLIGRFAMWCVRNQFRILDMIASPILGSSGNREFFFWLRPLS